MAQPAGNDRLNRLLVYAEKLRQRLTGAVPEKYKNRPEIFKQMIEIDLKKTEATITKLR